MSVNSYVRAVGAGTRGSQTNVCSWSSSRRIHKYLLLSYTSQRSMASYLVSPKSRQNPNLAYASASWAPGEVT